MPDHDDNRALLQDLGTRTRNIGADAEQIQGARKLSKCRHATSMHSVDMKPFPTGVFVHEEPGRAEEVSTVQQEPNISDNSDNPRASKHILFQNLANGTALVPLSSREDSPFHCTSRTSRWRKTSSLDPSQSGPRHWRAGTPSAGSTGGRHASQRAQLEKQQAVVLELERQIATLKILAPFDGQVGQLPITPGSRVEAGALVSSVSPEVVENKWSPPSLRQRATSKASSTPAGLHAHCRGYAS